MNIKDKIAQRKSQLIASASFSDKAVDELARNELADDTVKILSTICANLESLTQASGSGEDWKILPKYEYGSVNSMIGKFIQQWVYLPDTLKQLSGLTIPVTAFTADSVNAWGKLSRCTPLGELLPANNPDLDNVALQCQLVQVYLELPYIDPVMTQADWDVREAKAKQNAERKYLSIQQALAEIDEAEDSDTFVI